MLTYKNTNIFFIAILALLIGLNSRYSVPPFAYVLLLTVYSLVIFYGCYFVHSNFFIPIICSAETTQKQIAISFDDGPATSFTPEILEILKTENVPAAFFCIGKRIAGNEEILKQVYADHHLVGNHSYSHHFLFDLFSRKKMLDDLQLMNTAMHKVLGVTPKLFRPPYGVTNPNLARAITDGNFTPIGWNIRSMDTVIKSEATLLNKVNKALKPGAVILFHDTSKTTLAILPAFIQQAKQNGYQITRLDHLLNLQAYA